MKSLVIIRNRKVRIKRQRVHIRYVYVQMTFSPLNLSSKSGLPRQNCKSFVFTFFSYIHVCTVTGKKVAFPGGWGKSKIQDNRHDGRRFNVNATCLTSNLYPRAKPSYGRRCTRIENSFEMHISKSFFIIFNIFLEVQLFVYLY